GRDRDGAPSADAAGAAGRRDRSPAAPRRSCPCLDAGASQRDPGPDVLGPEGARLDPPGEGRAQRLGAVVLEQGEAGLDIEAPAGRAPMDQLREPGLGLGPELPEALPLEVEPPPDAPDLLQRRGTVLRPDTALARAAAAVGNREPGLGDDLDPVPGEVERGR